MSKANNTDKYKHFSDPYHDRSISSSAAKIPEAPSETALGYPCLMKII